MRRISDWQGEGGYIPPSPVLFPTANRLVPSDVGMFTILEVKQMAWKRLLACSILILALILSIGCPKKPGALMVNLAPDEAVAAGAQ